MILGLNPNFVYHNYTRIDRPCPFFRHLQIDNYYVPQPLIGNEDCNNTSFVKCLKTNDLCHFLMYT